MADKNEPKNPIVIIEDVTAVYPRMDKPYRFDKAKDKTVPAGAFDNNAAYQTQIDMPTNKAKELYIQMADWFMKTPKRKDDWDDELENPFEGVAKGVKRIKAKIAAAYGADAVSPPNHWDADNNLLPEGFELTHGSKISIQVELVPYMMVFDQKKNLYDNSVTLRLRGVQVLELAERSAVSPFGSVEGGYTMADPDSAFPNKGRSSMDEEEEEEDEEDAPPPKSKAKAKPKAKAKSKAPAGGFDDDDDDDAPPPKKAADKKAAGGKSVEDLMDDWDD